MQIPSWPQLGDEETAAAVRALQSNRLSQIGDPETIERFENLLAGTHGVRHAVAVNSGTSAVHLALAALRVTSGDEIIVPAHTFVASATPVLYQGGRPVFADVREQDFCVDPADVRARITPRTKAILAVHLNGHPAQLAALRAMCDEHGISLVEDAAQAQGARYRGAPVGSFGRLACLSFWQDKIMTTAGEGGAVLTDDEDLAVAVRTLRNHGEMPTGEPRLYHHQILGYNYRMTTVQAAVGIVQLSRVEHYLQRRAQNAERLTALLDGTPGIVLPRAAPGCSPSWWKYTCLLDDDLGVDAAPFTASLRERGIPANPRYPIPLHRQPVFEVPRSARQRLPVAERVSLRGFSLPVHPALEDRHLEQLAAGLVAEVARLKPVDGSQENARWLDG